MGMVFDSEVKRYPAELAPSRAENCEEIVELWWWAEWPWWGAKWGGYPAAAAAAELAAAAAAAAAEADVIWWSIPEIQKNIIWKSIIKIYQYHKSNIKYHLSNIKYHKSNIKVQIKIIIKIKIIKIKIIKIKIIKIRKSK